MPSTPPREWALSKFDAHGPFFIKSVAELVRATHEEHSRAQAEISSRRQGVYGQTNQDAQSRFRDICRDSNVPLISVKPRSPKVALLNGYIVIIWRYGHTENVDVLAKRFGTSEYRSAHFTKTPPADSMTPLFEMEISPELSEEDKKLLQAVKGVAKKSNGESKYYPVIVFAYASNASGIHKAIAAEAALLDDGRLKLEEICNFSDAVNNPSQTSDNEISKRFDQAPPRPTGIKARTSNDEKH